MKYLFLVFTSCLLVLKQQAQNVGIGTPTPLARLHVTDSSIVFSATGIGPATPGNPPISGEGRRMMWYPDKTAFRAGYVPGTQWDKDNIGFYSIAMGYSAIASGQSSVSMGNLTLASGISSTAMGGGTTASGFASTAMGAATYAKAPASLSMGLYNDDTDTPDPIFIAATDRIFQIGNGTSSARSNAITVLRNGNVGIGATAPSEKLEVTGNVMASTFKYSTPKIHYYSIPCIEFASINSGYLVFNQIASGGAYISNAPGTGGLNAPLHLPDGALLLSLRFEFYDASATQDIQGNLVTQPLDGYGSFAGVQSSGSGGNSIQTSDFGPGGVVINNQTTAYFVLISATSGAWNTPDLRIKRVIASYSLAEAQ